MPIALQDVEGERERYWEKKGEEGDLRKVAEITDTDCSRVQRSRAS